MSRGIPNGLTVGSPPAFRSKMPRLNRVRANKILEYAQVIRETFGKSSLRLRVDIQSALDRVSQIKQPLLDKDRHVTHV